MTNNTAPIRKGKEETNLVMSQLSHPTVSGASEAESNADEKKKAAKLSSAAFD